MNEKLQAYLFKSLDGNFGITTDDEGKNLPVNIGPWTYWKPIQIGPEDKPRIGASLNSLEFHRTLENQGYVLQKAGIIFTEKPSSKDAE